MFMPASGVGSVGGGITGEVHFTAVGGFDKSIPLAGNKFRHMAMVFRVMRLDLAAHFARTATGTVQKFRQRSSRR
jgi:hypothetical protein